ncbi:flagellar brake domain-containing protein [Anaerocolumna sp. AGMB13025]|uniref:flagellar brake protein n=1 Tax=Anaerocolumna sp. AGMB13025 TaxID=3039116 RepID=UPI00241C7EAA|nr:flagellar brake domain-containing protein [Anaerocolumna sp. AGMB13025]WFR54958.1 flagellar brake domain-containing protein [Anaerocolumna sp. AGMB13025]
MVSDIVSIGDKLELKSIRFSAKEIENEKVYKSQVLDFIDEDTASILMPIEGGRVIPLTIGDKYNLCFYTKKGLYQCKSVITDRSRINNVFVLTVQFTSELEKYQRRQYYRLKYLLEFKYSIITDMEISIMNKLRNNNAKKEEEKQAFLDTLDSIKKEILSGTILDISGGGARFVSGHNHEHGIMIQMLLDFDNGLGAKSFQIQAIIVSSDKMINRQGFYEHRVQFIDMTKEEREAIIKFIFEEERRQRKKEKG